MYGATVYGFGSRNNPALLLLSNDNNQLLYRGQAELFIIKRGEQIIGERVQSSVYMGKDSIFHPSVNVRYNIPQRQLQLSCGDRGSDRNPFFSSHHNMNLDVDRINAYFERDSIYFGERNVANTFKKDVFFESAHYFKQSDYQKIQSIASRNPLVVMKMVAEKEGGPRGIAEQILTMVILGTRKKPSSHLF